LQLRTPAKKQTAIISYHDPVTFREVIHIYIYISYSTSSISSSKSNHPPSLHQASPATIEQAAPSPSLALTEESAGKNRPKSSLERFKAPPAAASSKQPQARGQLAVASILGENGNRKMSRKAIAENPAISYLYQHIPSGKHTKNY